MKKLIALLTVALISAGTFAGIANADRGCNRDWDPWDRFDRWDDCGCR